MNSTAPGSASKLKTLYMLTTRFAGFGYNTKRIHSMNIRGKYLRRILLDAFSDLPELPFIPVVSIELPVTYLLASTVEKALTGVPENPNMYWPAGTTVTYSILRFPLSMSRKVSSSMPK
jgi:hypothetical protein